MSIKQNLNKKILTFNLKSKEHSRNIIIINNIMK